MNQPYDAWIAHFDLLGFSAKLKALPASFLCQQVNEIVHDFLGEANEFANSIDYLFYADSFIFYSKSDSVRDYPGLMHVATHFMQKCIFKGTALRGAIAYGEIMVCSDKRIMLGSAFLESHQCCEDQNWLGLILTPTASDRLNKANLNPARHGFVFHAIPRRECAEPARMAYAYSFYRGPANFACPLLPKLREMQTLSPEKAKVKYENTILFVEKYWRIYNLDLECAAPQT